MQKIDISTLTKTDRKIIYSLSCLTLQLRKKATKTTHATLAEYCKCSEKTVQRTVSKLEKANLITRGKPKWKRSAWFINLSADFYEQLKVVYSEQKKLSTRSENVHSGRTINIKKNNIINNPQTLNSKITTTEIETENVKFFISEEILGIDLKNLDKEIGLTHLDLELISRKIGWKAIDLQASVNNYQIALTTGTFSPRIPAREAFIGIHSGNKNNLPRLFLKPQALINQEKEAQKQVTESNTITPENKMEDEIQTSKENYWLSLSLAKKNKYLQETKTLQEAIDLASARVITDHEEFSVSSILKMVCDDLPKPSGRPRFFIGNRI